ncbi:c-type cytochrome [Brevundimonas vesicularis]|nr:cytochrome c [Brevundimonas vesicularis]MDX2333564.1 cytochrome c [Brevundimonas vesicularis]
MKRLVLFAALVALGGCKSLDVEAPDRRADGDQIGLFGDALATARGAAYAQAKCAGCHSVGRTGASPNEAAPRLRALSLSYPIEDLAEAFAEGIDTAHPAMPEFVMSSRENADLIAYLKSIQSSASP